MLFGPLVLVGLVGYAYWPWLRTSRPPRDERAHRPVRADPYAAPDGPVLAPSDPADGDVPGSLERHWWTEAALRLVGLLFLLLLIPLLLSGLLALSGWQISGFSFRPVSPVVLAYWATGAFGAFQIRRFRRSGRYALSAFLCGLIVSVWRVRELSPTVALIFSAVVLCVGAVLWNPTAGIVFSEDYLRVLKRGDPTVRFGFPPSAWILIVLVSLFVAFYKFFQVPAESAPAAPPVERKR